MERISKLMQRTDEKEQELTALRQQYADKQDSARKKERSVAEVRGELENSYAKIREQEVELQRTKNEMDTYMKQALDTKLTQDEFNAQLTNMQREMNMKDIEVKVQQSKLKQMKEENVTIRMQLLDPSNIKRGAVLPSQRFDQGVEQAISGEVVNEFVRVQKNYDAVMLQEELKQMLVENTLLKEKIAEL